MSNNGAKKRRLATGEGKKSPCTGDCQAAMWKDRYERLRDRTLELGLIAVELLNEKQKYSLVVMQFIRDNYGDLKVGPESLSALKPEVKRAAKDFLYAVLQGNLRRKDIVNEVFREPRKPRGGYSEEYRIEYP